MTKINKAKNRAFELFHNIKDDNGESYFHAHLLQVADIISIVTDNEDMICAAFLHDAIEDTEYKYDDIKRDFGVKVADLVNEVTHEGQKDDYGYYFPRLKTREGIMLKLADRLSNISRMETWDEKRKAQYLRKTKFWKDGSDKQAQGDE